MLGVTTGGPGLIAVGFRGEGDQLDAVVWASTEGETWQLATDQEGVLRSQGGQVMADAIELGDGLVAVGADGREAGFNTAVWDITLTRLAESLPAILRNTKAAGYLRLVLLYPLTDRGDVFDLFLDNVSVMAIVRARRERSGVQPRGSGPLAWNCETDSAV